MVDKELQENEYYLVRIEETLARTVKVSKTKAGSAEGAEEYVRSLYKAYYIVLDAEDFFDNNITGREVTDEDLSLYEDAEEYESEYSLE